MPRQLSDPCNDIVNRSGRRGGWLWYVSPMELLILILVVLAIVALLVYILRGRRR